MNVNASSRKEFDRFGDDLCEFILSFLPINDCFRLQYVSKQWKALIFKGHRALKIISSFTVQNLDQDKNTVVVSFDECNLKNKNNINLQILSNLLKKCCLINKLTIGYYFDNENDIINVIANYCPFLKSLTIYSMLDNFSQESIRRLGKKCGLNLKSLCISSNSSTKLKQLIKATPNLKQIEIRGSYPGTGSQILMDANNGKNFLPKLEVISSELYIEDGFENFVEQFSNHIKKLYICLVIRKNEILYGYDGFRQLTKFKCLHSLKINCIFIECEISTFIKILKKIISCCKNLKELELENICDIRLFECFVEGFESLRKLRLKSYFFSCSNFEFLKSCVNVTRLNVFQRDLNANLFKLCHLFIPKIKSMKLSACGIINDEMLVCLLQLKHLRNLKLECRASINKSLITEKGICNFIENSKKLQKIYLNIEDIEQLSFDQLENFGLIYIYLGELRIFVKKLVNQLTPRKLKSSPFTRQIFARYHEELCYNKMLNMRFGFKNICKKMESHYKRIAKIKILAAFGIVCQPFMIKEYFVEVDDC